MTILSSMESLLDPTRQYIHGSFCCPPFDPQRHQQKKHKSHVGWLMLMIYQIVPGWLGLYTTVKTRVYRFDMDISRFQLQQSCGVEAPVYFTGFLVTLLKRSFMWNTTSSRLEKVQCSEESFALIQQKIHIARRLMYIKKKYRMSLHPKLCQSHPSFQSRTWVRDAFMWASKGIFPNAVGCLSFLLLWLAKDTSKLKSLRSWPSKRLKISSGSWVWEAWQKKHTGHHNQGSGQGG